MTAVSYCGILISDGNFGNQNSVMNDFMKFFNFICQKLLIYNVSSVVGLTEQTFIHYPIIGKLYPTIIDECKTVELVKRITKNNKHSSFKNNFKNNNYRNNKFNNSNLNKRIKLSIKNGYCYSFNKKGSCDNDPCNYKHSCDLCDKNIPRINCECKNDNKSLNK